MGKMSRLSERGPLYTHISKGLKVKIRIAPILLSGIPGWAETPVAPQRCFHLKQEMFYRKSIVEEVFR